MDKRKEDSLLSSPPFGSLHNPFQSCGKIYEVKFSFFHNRLPQARALRENNRNVVVVVNKKNRMWKRKKGMWESEKLFS